MDNINMSLDDIIRMKQTSECKTIRKSNKEMRRKDSRSKGKAIDSEHKNFQQNTLLNKVTPSRPNSFNFGNKYIPNKVPHQVNSLHAKMNTSQSISISNLAPSVSDSDIIQLFSEFGQLEKTAVHYDIQGCHLGTASVTFAKCMDARKAVMKYNGVSLDRLPMRIHLNQSEGINFNRIQGPSDSLAMRLNISNNCGNMEHCQPYESAHVPKYKQNIIQGKSLFDYDEPIGIKRDDRTEGDNKKSQQKRKWKPDLPEANQKQLDKELDEYMGTTKWVRGDAKKKNIEVPMQQKYQKKLEQTKKRKSTSILEPDESSSTSEGMEVDKKSQVKQEELDQELDEFIAQEKKITSNEQAEKIQRKLLNLI